MTPTYDPDNQPIEFGFSPDAGKAGDAIPVGPYTCRVKECKRKVSKAGNNLLELVLEVFVGPHSGRTLYDNIVFTQAAEKVTWFKLRALGFPLAPGQTFKGTPAEFVGRMVNVVVKHEPDMNDSTIMRARVGRMTPYQQGAAPGGGGAVAGPAKIEGDDLPF